MRRYTGFFGRMLVLAAMAPLLQGCAELAGLEDRKKDEGQSSSGTGGGGSGGGGGGCASSGSTMEPIVLAEKEDSPRAIVVDRGGIYWINEGILTGEGAVRGLFEACGAPVNLAVTTKRPYAIAADDNYIYWSNGRGANDCDPEDPMDVHQDEVRRVRKDARAGAGGEAMAGEPLWDNCGRPDSIAVDESRVYMARPKSRRVQSITKDSLTIVTFLQTEEGESEPLSITESGEYIYWTDGIGKSITSARKVFDDMRTIVVDLKNFGGGTPGLIASDKERIYWLTESSLQSCKIEECSPSAEPHVLIPELTKPSGLAVHKDHVYVTDSEKNVVLRVRRDTPGTVETIATDQLRPMGVVADDTAVYWVNYGSGEVMTRKHP